MCELRRCRLEIDRLKLEVRELEDENNMLKDACHGSGAASSAFPSGGAATLVQAIAAADFQVLAGGPYGAGAFGEVVKGQLHATKTLVAVKLPGPASAGRADWQERLMQEVQVHVRVRSRHLMPIMAMCPARLALLYPWADHGSLQDWLLAAPPAPGPGLDAVLGAARGLRVLHRCGLVHGDVRSAHILLFSQPCGVVCGGDIEVRLGGCGRVCQEDISHARLVEASPNAQPYTDPLCLLTGRTSWTSDVFSLGVVLLEVLLGKSAAPARGAEDMGAAIHTRGPRPRPLWLQFRQSLDAAQGQGSGDSPASAASNAADAVLHMIPRLEWNREALLVAAKCLVAMLKVSVSDAINRPSLAVAPAPDALERCLPARPTAIEVLEHLEAARSLQGASAGNAERERICVVCMDAQVDARFSPCQHAALCTDCASIFVARSERCPICRCPVDGFDMGDFQKTFAF